MLGAAMLGVAMLGVAKLQLSPIAVRRLKRLRRLAELYSPNGGQRKAVAHPCIYMAKNS